MTVKLSALVDVQALTRQAERDIRDLVSKPLYVTVKTDLTSLRTMSGELGKIRKATKAVETGFEDFASKAALAGKRFAAFTVATTGFFALGSALTSAIKDASSFEVELLKVRQVTRDSESSIKSLGKEVFKVATGLGVSSKELLSVGLTLGQAGRSIQDIKESLSALAKTRLAATFGDITNTVNALIAAQEQFNLVSGDTEQVLGSINVLSARYAVEAQDLTTAIQKAGGAFSTLGKSTDTPKQKLNELLALFTAVRSTTRESADTIATGFRTIFARLRRPQTITMLEAFGINLKDESGLLKKPFEQIKAISQAVKGLDKRDIRFSQIIEEIGGIRQQSKVIPLLEQIEKAERALITATQGANSLTRDAEIAQESLANQLAKTREEFLKLIQDGFESESFQKFSQILLSITNGFIDMSRAVGPLIPALTALTAINFVKSVPGGGASGFDQLKSGIKKQFVKTPTKFAKGGIVPGTGNTDSVHAMLTPGELVVPKDKVQKFADGGQVKRIYDKVSSIYFGQTRAKKNDLGREYLTGNYNLKNGRSSEELDTSFDGPYGKLFKRIIDKKKKSGEQIRLDSLLKDFSFQTSRSKTVPASIDLDYNDSVRPGLSGRNRQLQKYKNYGDTLSDSINEKLDSNNSINYHQTLDNDRLGEGGSSGVRLNLKELGKLSPIRQKRTINHEIVHNFDAITARGADFASSQPGSKLYDIAQNLSKLSTRLSQRLNLGNKKLGNPTDQTNFGEYVSRPEESLAFTLQGLSHEEIANVFAGKQNRKGLRRSLRNFLEQVKTGETPRRPYILDRISGNDFKGYARGGPVGGTGRGDKVPAMLEPGEFVIPRDKVSKHPKEFWEALRRGEKPTGYSDGGLVGGVDIKAPTKVLEKQMEELFTEVVKRSAKFATNAAEQLETIRKELGRRKQFNQEIDFSDRERTKNRQSRAQKANQDRLDNVIANRKQSSQNQPVYNLGGNGPLPSPPFVSPIGPYGPNPPPNRGPGPFNKVSNGVNSAFQKVQENPTQAAIGLAVASSILSEFKESLGPELASFAKGVQTAATQFVLLSTILGTFGRTAKESQKLEADSIKFAEQNNKRISATNAKLAGQDIGKEIQNVQGRIDRRSGIREKREAELSSVTGFLNKGKLDKNQQKDLQRVKFLQNANSALSQGPEAVDKLKQSLVKRAKEERLRNLTSGNTFGKKGNISPVEEVLNKQITFLNDKNNFPLDDPAKVSQQRSKNESEIKKILGKAGNTDLLDRGDQLSQAKARKKELSAQIRRLKAKEGKDAKGLKDLVNQKNEISKVEQELRDSLVSSVEFKDLTIQNQLFNDKAVAGRRTKSDLARRAKLEGNLTGAIAVAGGVGSIFSELGDKEFDKNPKSSGAQAGLLAGATLGGAAQGGAVGLAVGGPIGAAVGAAAGGLYAFYNENKRINEALRDLRLDESLRKFNKSLELIKDPSKKLGAVTQIEVARSTVRETDKEFILSGGAKDQRDRSENLAGGVNEFLNSLATSGITINEFNKQSKGLIEFVSRFTNTSLKELNTKFQELIESTAKNVKVNKQISAASLREDTRAILTTGLLNSFSDIGETLKEFDDIVSGGISDLSGVFSRLGQIQDTRLLGRANQQASGLLGGLTGGKEFIQESNLINEIGLKLPTILNDVFKQGALELQGGDAIQVIGERIKELTGNNEQAFFIGDAIITALSDKVKNSDLAKEIAGGNLKNVVDPILDNLRKGVGDVLGESIKLRSQELKLIENTLNKVQQLRTQQSELASANVDIAERVATGRTSNGSISLEQSKGFDLQRLQAIFGRGNEGNARRSPEQLLGRLTGARSRLKEIETELSKGENKNLLQLQEARAKELDIIARTTNALKFMADASNRVAKLDEEIARAKSLREAKQGILEDFAFADPASRREQLKGFAATRQVFNTGSLGGIPPQLLGAVKANLDRVPKDTKLGNGKTVEEFLREVSLNAIKPFTTPEAFESIKKQVTESDNEKKLKGEKEGVLQKAEESNNNLIKDSINQERLLSATINQQFPEFISRLTDLFNKNRERDLDLRVQQKGNALGQAIKTQERADALGNVLKGTRFSDLTNQDAGDLRAGLPVISDIKSSQDKLNNLNKIPEFRNIKGLNKEQINDRLSELFQPLQEAFGAEGGSNLFNQLKEITDEVGYQLGNKKINPLFAESLENRVQGKIGSTRQEEITKTKKSIEDQKSALRTGKNGVKIDDNERESLLSNFDEINKLFGELGQLQDGALPQLRQKTKDLTQEFELLAEPLRVLRAEITASRDAVVKNFGVQQGTGVGLAGLGVFRANGGFIPGAGNSDSVPAMLTPGEFVLKKSAAEALGPDTLNQLNHYAEGGKVEDQKKSPLQMYSEARGNSGDFGKLSEAKRREVRASFQRYVRLVRRDGVSDNPSDFINKADKAASYFLADQEENRKKESNAARSVNPRGLSEKARSVMAGVQAKKNMTKEESEAYRRNLLANRKQESEYNRPRTFNSNQFQASKKRQEEMRAEAKETRERDYRKSEQNDTGKVTFDAFTGKPSIAASQPKFGSPKNVDLGMGSKGNFGKGSTPYFNTQRQDDFRSLPLSAGIGDPEFKPNTRRSGNFMKPIKRATGGPVPGGSSTSSSKGKGLECTLNSESLAKFEKIVADMSKPILTLSESLSKIPTSISLQGEHTLTVNHNGASVFNTLEDKLKELVLEETKKSINALIDRSFPTLSRV